MSNATMYADAYDAAIEDTKGEVVYAINQIRVGKYEDAIVTLERAFLPAWKDAGVCEARYR